MAASYFDYSTCFSWIGRSIRTYNVVKHLFSDMPAYRRTGRCGNRDHLCKKPDRNEQLYGNHRCEVFHTPPSRIGVLGCSTMVIGGLARNARTSLPPAPISHLLSGRALSLGNPASPPSRGGGVAFQGSTMSRCANTPHGELLFHLSGR